MVKVKEGQATVDDPEIDVEGTIPETPAVGNDVALDHPGNDVPLNPTAGIDPVDHEAPLDGNSPYVPEAGPVPEANNCPEQVPAAPLADNTASTAEIFDFNAYAAKKTSSQQILSTSVFAANFGLLASLWSTEHRPRLFVVWNVFVIISLCLTITLATVGMRLHYLNINKGSTHQNKAILWNDFATGLSLALLFTTIAGFSGTAFGTSWSNTSTSSGA